MTEPHPEGRSERVELLRRTLFFHDAPEDLLAKLAELCGERALEPGEVLCEVGDPGDALYVVAEGSLDVYRGEALLDVSPAGQCLGEMALLTGEPRTASLRGRQPARILELKLTDFRDALGRYPELAWGIFRELIAKMKSSIDVRVEQDRRQRQLKEAFARSVSQAVMDEILSHEDPGELLAGQAQRATVLFSDVRGFTSISEQLTPAEVVGLLNEYLSEMVDAIMDCGGTLDKIMGDGILAHFGIPLPGERDAENAVRCAVDMQRRLAEPNRSGPIVSRHPLKVGVGLATGEVVAGCIGSQQYMEYTAISDVVNLASRLEGLTKFYRVPLILDGATAAALDAADDLRRVDRVRVKGRATPSDLYTLWSLGPEGAKELAAEYDAGFALYMRGRFEEAATQLEEVKRRLPGDVTTALLAERCRHFAAFPPAGWDGVFTHTAK